MAEHEAPLESEPDHPAPLRTTPRGVPAKVPAGAFVLP
jgi:hypothetical protein